MKLNRVLTINQTEQQLINERIVLDLHSPGRAEFTIAINKQNSTITPHQLVTFDLGYSQQETLQRWFIGATAKIVPIGNNQFKVFCRELSAALGHPLALNLRHINLREVLEQVSSLTGLNFATPDKAYATTQIANFYNIGNGYQIMTAIGRVFNIPDFIWQQQSGIIYVGSWADSRWATINPIQLPPNLFENHSAQQSMQVAALPILRPGMQVNGQRITAIEFAKNKMVLSWKN